MATGNGSYYLTAGLSIAKDDGQSPTGNGSYFFTAGLLKEVEAGAPPASDVPMLALLGVGQILLAISPALWMME